MDKQKLVTLIVPSLVLGEFRRLGWIYPSRLLVTYLAEQQQLTHAALKA